MNATAKKTSRVLRQIWKAFSSCRSGESILKAHCVSVGEARNLVISYKKLMKLGELREFKKGTVCIKEYEPHMRFVIQHYFYVDEQDLLALMPYLLTGYVCQRGRFDEWVPFSRCLLEMKHKVGTTVSWSKKQEEATSLVLRYVFESSLEERKMFDESLFCFLLLFLHDMNDIVSCLDRVFSDTSPGVAEQIGDFFENDILFWVANGHFTAQTLSMAVMEASGVILGQCRPEKILRDKILAERKEFLWQQLSEERLLSYILERPVKTAETREAMPDKGTS